MTDIPDLTYREVGGRALQADLYLPRTEQPPPGVVYVHGGGFQVGSRTDDAELRLTALAAHGLAVLSVDYRLAPADPFPAAVHDVRAAVRWFRTHAADLGVDGARLALWGASAGATLASLVALTEAAGGLGDGAVEPWELAAVQAVVAWFGMSDLMATASRSWLETAILPFDFEAAFLGVGSVGEVAGVADRARDASPLSWVSPGAPPFLIAHGDRDRITPASQSQLLHDALVRVGVPSSLLLLGGAGHEDRAFESPASLAVTAGWLVGTLRGR
ncbi:alpha/beta hydrolase fold domain-containing protein [Actinomycetospora atypica]|uniref:Alpha/beta hydrolase fold domain-containing protein n=1 Tax=Actinomycetospora atypica TaxID=1290095 RepID=A0ABV9YPP1_9PSEU